MSQKLPVKNFKRIEDTSLFTVDFVQKYNEKCDEGYFIEVDVQCREKLYELCNDLPILLERKKLQNVEKLVANLHYENEYVIYIRNLKQLLNHGLILKNVHRVIKFNQEDWSTPHITMNSKLRQEAKINFEKRFFKLMNNAVFGKTMANVKKIETLNL